MASAVISQCVVRANGMGGFVTNGLERLIGTLMDSPTLPTAQYTYREFVLSAGYGRST